MTRGRPLILMGMAGGALWAAGIVFLAPRIFANSLGWQAASAISLMLGGLVLMVMIGRLAAIRFFSEPLIDGEAFNEGSPGEINQRVLSNTVEQLILALTTWPFVAWGLGGATTLALGTGFVLARLAFWVGYHRAPALRSFGFAATFYPTVLAVVMTIQAIL